MNNTIAPGKDLAGLPAASAQGRVLAIDFGRGLAVILMVFVHTLWMYANPEVQGESWLGHVVHFLGKGTAAFLLCMGVSMMLSRRQDLAGDVQRGLLILAFGFFMNFMKFVVPIAGFGTMPESFIEAYGWQSPLEFEQLRYLVLTGDILQLAGLSLLLLAFVRRFVTNKYVVLGLAIAVMAISREVSGYRPGIPGLDYVADLFFADNYHIYFPVVPWISFILYGMFVGMHMKELGSERDKVFGYGLRIGIGLVIAGGAMCYLDFDYHFGNFFHLGPGGVLYLAGINLVLVWFIQRLVTSGIQNRAMDFLYYCSERVTSMYIIQWILICWGMGVIGFQTLNTWQTLALMPVMFGLTLLAQWVKDWLFSPGRLANMVRGRNAAKSGRAGHIGDELREAP